MKAIVLKRRDFRENDQLITLYTLEKGKITILARGVKKITAKNAAFLEPFFYLEAEIVPGKETKILTTATGLETFKYVRGDLAKMSAAAKAVGLLDRMVEENAADSKIFFLLKSWLEFLEKNQFGPGLYFGFLTRLTKILGFEPLLSKCVACGRAGSENKELFSVMAGGLVCRDCAQRLSGKELTLSNVDRAAYTAFLHQGIEKWPVKISPALAQAIRLFAQYHTEKKLAKPGRIL